jgi:hypothetical protein
MQLIRYFQALPSGLLELMGRPDRAIDPPPRQYERGQSWPRKLLPGLPHRCNAGMFGDPRV